MNQYRELRNKHYQEGKAFRIKFAYSQERFDECMKELGLEPTDTDKVCNTPTGGFILKSEEKALYEMYERHLKEHEAAIAADKTGDGYIFDMFYTELIEREYGFTEEVDETLESLGITLEQVRKNPLMIKALKHASEKILNMRWLP